MQRVTSEEVKILLDGLAVNTDVSLFIEQANVLVDEEFAGTTLTEARLRLIELNLAAHYAVLAIERGGMSLRRMNDTEERYGMKADKAKLSSTRFGETAVSMDTTGKLSAMDSPKGVAEFRVV